MKVKAVCLLSGGLDSTTTLYVALREGYEAYCLTLSYGQTHHKEVERARSIASHLGCEHELIEFTLPWKGSALLDRNLEIPKGRSFNEIGSGIPSTYVPARNTIFLSLAFSWAEVVGAEAIFIGANALDYSGYPDCRPEYFEVMERVFSVATRSGTEGISIRVKAPLLQMTKGEIVRLADQLGVPLDKTWSCYQGGETPCRICDSCLLRENGFLEAGISDPLLLHSEVPSR